jgi:hypothetical protein
LFGGVEEILFVELLRWQLQSDERHDNSSSADDD